MELSFTFGEYSSEELGVIAVHFGTISGGELHEGMVTDLKVEKAAQSPKFEIVSQKDKQPQQFIIQIVNEDGSDISAEQERFLEKVLCKRKQYDWLFFHGERYSDIWIECNWSNAQVWTVGTVKGMQFEVNSSSPYLFTDEREYNYILTETDKVINDLYINNDADYLIYPEVEITMLEAGDLTITNAAEKDTTYITELNNLAVGETITIKDEEAISSISSHDIFNDTNYNWLRFYDGYNQLTFNLKCEVIIKFREYRSLIVV